MTQTRETWFR